MGADFLMASLTSRTDKALDWPAGHEHIEKELDLREFDEPTVNSTIDVCYDISTALAQSMVEYDPDRADAAETRAALHQLLVILERTVEWGVRDATNIELVGGWRMTISGGMSWGDSPSETCDLIWALDHFPSVLSAVGFENMPVGRAEWAPSILMATKDA